MDFSEFTLRPAAKEDLPGIRRLIHKVGINPTGLDWRRFIIAVDTNGVLVACGQLKPHGLEVIELASIAVEEAFRSRGVARAIIEYLIAKSPRPLYLTCRSSLQSFYSKWGFRSAEMDEMPSYFRRLVRWARAYLEFTRQDETLLVMILE